MASCMHNLLHTTRYHPPPLDWNNACHFPSCGRLVGVLDRESALHDAILLDLLGRLAACFDYASLRNALQVIEGSQSRRGDALRQDCWTIFTQDILRICFGRSHGLGEPCRPSPVPPLARAAKMGYQVDVVEVVPDMRCERSPHITLAKLWFSIIADKELGSERGTQKTSSKKYAIPCEAGQRLLTMTSTSLPPHGLHS